MGAKKSLTGEEMEQQEEQDAMQKIAEAEALAVQQSGNNVNPAKRKCIINVGFVNNKSKVSGVVYTFFNFRSHC